MEVAIDAGHSNPTGEDLKNALETFRSLDTGGLTAGPITFTSTDHRPQSTENIYKIDSAGQLAFVNGYSIQIVPQWLGY
jgi:branched-chain amino acid transport system substrate-binding protein